MGKVISKDVSHDLEGLFIQKQDWAVFWSFSSCYFI